MGQQEIVDSRAVLVSLFFKGEAALMESALLQRNLLRGSDTIRPNRRVCSTQYPSASNMPVELSCLNRALPLGCDTLAIETFRPFTLPSRLQVRGQVKRALPDLSHAYRKEIRVKNQKENHHPTHQSHWKKQELARIAIKNHPPDYSRSISDRGDK